MHGLRLVALASAGASCSFSPVHEGMLAAALPRVSDMNNNFTCMDNVSTTAQQLGFFTTCPSTGLRRV
eukprot:1160256-Pelagomonas_calceolata.AAC.26